MRKWISILLALTFCISFYACGENTETSVTTETTNVSETEKITTTETTTETVAQTTTETVAQTTEVSVATIVTEITTSASTKTERDYILNTNSKKFHYPTCHSAEKISDKNRKDYHGTRDDLISQGYSACGICNP